MSKRPGIEKQFRLFGIPIFSIRSTSMESDLLTPAQWLREAFGAIDTDSGVNVNEDKALTISAVYACVRVISEAYSVLPKHVYTKKDARTREELSEHPIQRLIGFQPSEYCTPFDYFNTQLATVLLWGNAFSIIHRDKNYIPNELEIIHPKDVTIVTVPVDKDNKIKNKLLAYRLTDGRIIMPYDMLHFKGLGFDGVQGRSIVAYYAKESLGLTIATEKFGARFFGKNTNISTYFTTAGTLSDKAFERLSNDIKDLTGMDNTFKRPPILEQGLDLKNVTIPPEQAQFLGTRQHQVEEVCRWFKVQPHLIQHLLRSTNNNIEQQSIEFVIHTVLPWVVRIEQEMNLKLFTTKEMMKVYIKTNIGGLLRGDMNAQKEYYKTMVQNGIWSPNEVRELQDKNPYEGGDTYYIPTNMMPSDAEQGLQKINNKHERVN